MNNFKAEKMKREQGAITIAFALSVIVLVFMLAVTSMSYIGNDTKGASNLLINSKAFYGAEGGIELVLGELKNDGDGIFSNVTIGEALVSSTVTDDTLFTVAATVNGITESIQLVVYSLFSGAFYNAISSFDPTKELRFEGPHDKWADGEIFTYSTIGVYFAPGTIIGTVNVTVEEGVTVDNQSGSSITVDEFAPGATPETWPPFDTQYYDDFINNVGGYPSYGPDLITTDLNLSSFTDNVLFRTGQLRFKSGVTITGPGVIASAGDITVEETSTIGPDVKIIAGGEAFFKDASVLTGMESVLFATTAVNVGYKNDSFTSLEGSILSPTYVSVRSHNDLVNRGTIKGIIYSAGLAKINHVKVLGSIVANSFVDEEIHCTYIDFDVSYLPTTPPAGFNGPQTVIVQTWREQ